jgi:Tol biopolymer transport system component
MVETPGPAYQTIIIDTIGNLISAYGEYPENSQTFESMPTFGPDNHYAYVLFKDYNSVGVFISPLNKDELTDAEKKQRIKSIPGGYAPAWSPDGNWIAYMTKELSNQGIYITDPDVSETYLVYRPTVGLDLQTYPLSWSPDSKWLTFATKDGAIWIIDITGNGLKQVVGPGLNSAPAWSKTK